MKLFYSFSKVTLLLILITITSSLQAQRSRYYSPRHNTRVVIGSRPYAVAASRYTYMPRTSIHLSFGGSPYYYNAGSFYRPYGGYYQMIAPPFGIRISTLPYGYMPMRFGSGMFFYFNGIFYRQNNNYYEVVQAPVGAEVPSIPRQAQVVVIDNERYYELNGSYFQEVTRPNGQIWYRVAGKNGVLNTDNAIAQGSPTVEPPIPAPVIDQPAAPIKSNASIGDVLVRLPDNCKSVVISNKKYYVSPENVYYEELIENNELKYKVAGK